MAKKKKSISNIVKDAPAIWAGGTNYRAEDDHRTLTRAGEVMADKQRLREAKEHHKKMNKHMEKACK